MIRIKLTEEQKRNITRAKIKEGIAMKIVEIND